VTETLTNFINGKQRPPRGGKYLDNFEPATGKVYSRAPDSDEGDVAEAVSAAKAAFAGWAATAASERSRVLLKIADLIEANLDALAAAESRDTGKPIALARSLDIPRAASNFRFFATAILHGESAVHDGEAGFNYTLRRPRGVAGLISPWNLPLYLFSWKVAPALASGNTAVGKPSEVTPVTAWMLGEICNQAGLPPGVLNILHGTGPRAGGAIVTHPEVPTISFTGSTAVGKWIAEKTGPMFKRVSLELGGKNPNLIFADADLDAAVKTACRAAFTNQGQICLCGSRVFVERPVFDRVCEGLVREARGLRIGDPSEDSTQFGSLTSAAHLEKVESYVKLARELGGKVLCGGERASAPDERTRGGYWYQPTVITGLASDCRVMQEEIFGPVVTVTPFDREDEALAMANGTGYGLAAMVWTRDLSRAHRVSAALESGIVWVNCWLVRDLRTPFGGVKQSGVGREGGREALRFFTEAKNVCVRV
jgi:aminomuconate-semialdehyde/2-hydroxymuconate-6-semialdehyde dehydrogenase